MWVSRQAMNIPLTPLRFLRYAEKQYPRRIAVVCNDQTFTYAQFAARAGRLASALRQAACNLAIAWLSSAQTAIVCSKRTTA